MLVEPVFIGDCTKASVLLPMEIIENCVGVTGLASPVFAGRFGKIALTEQD